MAASDYVANPDTVAADGLSYELFYIENKDIVSFPVLVNTGTHEEEATYVGDFVLKTGTRWKKIECIPDSGEHFSEKVGEGNTWKNTVIGNLLGSDQNPKGFLSRLSNKRLIIIAPDKCGGVNHVLGSHCSPAKLAAAKVTTGGGGNNTRKSDFTFENMGAISPIYEGNIQLVPTP